MQNALNKALEMEDGEDMTDEKFQKWVKENLAEVAEENMEAEIKDLGLDVVSQLFEVSKDEASAKIEEIKAEVAEVSKAFEEGAAQLEKEFAEFKKKFEEEITKGAEKAEQQEETKVQ